MDSIPVRVLNKTGASDSADLIICPHCYAQNFFIYKLKNGHQHIQCANCDTSYCDGTCGRNDAPHSIVAIIEVS